MKGIKNIVFFNVIKIIKRKYEFFEIGGIFLIVWVYVEIIWWRFGIWLVFVFNLLGSLRANEEK